MSIDAPRTSHPRFGDPVDGCVDSFELAAIADSSANGNAGGRPIERRPERRILEAICSNRRPGVVTDLSRDLTRNGVIVTDDNACQRCLHVDDKGWDIGVCE